MAVNFFNIFSKKRIRVSHPDAPAFYAAHSGDTFSPGAPGMAFDAKFSNPLFVIRGPGIITGTMQVTEQVLVAQSLALPTNAYQGVPVGGLALQGLISQSDYPGEQND